MVLIISEEIDESTHDVIDWLIYKNTPYLVINRESLFNSSLIKISNRSIRVLLSFNGLDQEIDLSAIKSIWYRKGDLTIDLFSFLPDIAKELKKDLFDHLNNEWTTLKNFIFELLEDKRLLGNYFTHVKSKLGYLRCAAKCGISIPDTFIVNSKEDLFRIQGNYRRLITKSIHEIFNAVHDNESLFTYTTLVSERQIAGMPDTFFPSLLQNKIEKRFELRIFFLQKDLYPMAIFSQNDDNTKIDFRNYTDKKPNRTVPYTLPDNLKDKILAFIENCGLNTGSIDMVVTPGGEFIFLEVNQAGQFGFVSDACNYYLEKKVAEYLI